MTTAEIYRQLEQSPQMQIARYIFLNVVGNAEYFPLSEVIEEMKTGKTPSKLEKRFYEDGFIDWFKPNEVGSQMYLSSSEDKLSKFAVEKKQVTIYEPNSILINAIGDVGRVSILTTRASSNQQITGIKLNKRVIPEFAYYYLVCNRQLFLKDLFQTTLPIINQKKINSIPFLLPKIESQKKIVEFIKMIELVQSIDDFSLIDESFIDDNVKTAAKNLFTLQFGQDKLKNELSHQLELVSQLRQAFLREAMQGKLVPQDGQDEPAEILLEKIKAEKEKLIAEKKIKKQKPVSEITAEEIPFEIPSNWTWCRLGDICSKITDGFHNTPPKILKGFPYISATHVKSDKIDWNNCHFVSEQYHRELWNKTYPQKGELLVVNIGAGSATPAIIDVDFEFSFKNTAILKFNQSLIVNTYIFNFFLVSKEMIYAELTKGGLQPFLSLKILNEIHFPLPPLAEQKRIVEKLEKLMKFCDELEATIRQSTIQAETLLQVALKEALEPKESVLSA